ncbi:MAG: hypothetical protein A2293_04455 [Elusimicrobia bacterium RIFOXYB2_FULL_49_7]|nr:MAG: hypothetical protein A2293_04455 [Elusimicrobia bacterium RIFOXYB2_FULL_49_7]
MAPVSSVAVLFSIGCFLIILVFFLVIVKTLNGVGIALLRLEYLLNRELSLVSERERIKKQIMSQQAKEEEDRRKRETDVDPLLKIPYAVKKGNKPDKK